EGASLLLGLKQHRDGGFVSGVADDDGHLGPLPGLHQFLRLVGDDVAIDDGSQWNRGSSSGRAAATSLEKIVGWLLTQTCGGLGVGSWATDARREGVALGFGFL